MKILNLNTQTYLENFQEDFYNQDFSYLILSVPYELNRIQGVLNIDDMTFTDCLDFDENIKLDLFCYIAS